MTIVIIMGVSGCGKSTIGQQLAVELGWHFADADDFHSTANKAKMQRGEALDDCDRAPWLATLRTAIETWHQTHQPTVLACSALKASYRNQLKPANIPIQWVYLHGTFEQIQARLAQRQKQDPQHFMNPQLLKSQFEILEEPREGLRLEISQTPAELVADIKASLEAQEAWQQKYCLNDNGT